MVRIGKDGKDAVVVVTEEELEVVVPLKELEGSAVEKETCCPERRRAGLSIAKVALREGGRRPLDSSCPSSPSPSAISPP